MPDKETEKSIIADIMIVCMTEFKRKDNVPKESERLPLGDLALSALAHSDLGDLIPMHLAFAQNATVWGNNIDDEDKLSNDMSMADGNRVVSSWHLNGQDYFVITEHDRSVTTILRKEEY